MKNPFQYGKIAEKDNFIDRDVDRSFLKQALYSSQNVILVSPRRWGKSSLVKQSMHELCAEHKDVIVCYIDAFPIISSTEFYSIFAKEILKATASEWKSVMDSVGKFLKNISPKVSFSPDSLSEFSIAFDMSRGVEDEKDILNLPQKIAEEKGKQIIVCIDEFQRLAKLHDYERLESQMRSIWQHHHNVSYCLYGSQKHMMTDIFDSPEKPFYRFGQLYYLSKIDKSEWVTYIINRFKSTGKQISRNIAGQIVDAVDSHSWYVQQLSSAVWNFTVSTADEAVFSKAFVWCVDVNSEAYRNMSNTLTEAQINLLKAIADGEIKLSSTQTIKTYHLGTSANVTKNKKALQKMDVINIYENKVEFQDPLFKVWFIENYIKHI